MGINNIDIRDGQYGRINSYAKEGENDFTPYGKAATVEEIYRNIENGEVHVKLSYEFMDKQRKIIIPRSYYGSPAACEALAKVGIDTTKNDYAAFIDSLRLQEQQREEMGIHARPSYEHLGWITIPGTEAAAPQLCYRCHKLIGWQEDAKFIGAVDVRPLGSYQAWRNMVIAHVLPYPVLHLTTVAALSAVLNGLIAPATSGENPVLHLHYPSGKGKSTAAILAASTAGRPFDGVIRELDEDSNPIDWQSVYQSWGATDKALITSQAGNRGVVAVLNELGKSTSQDLTRALFDLSEGSDRKRLTTSLQTRISDRYTTVFISTGETSLLDRCRDKLEGLAIRVMEVSKPITESAEHSNIIKETCRKHCGHAAWRLAKFIIMRGGSDYLLPIYKKWLSQLKKEWPDTASRERFIEKFAALFLTTAEVATYALNIPFDIEGQKSFLIEHDREHGAERNTSAASYDAVLERCRINLEKFYRKDCQAAKPYLNSESISNIPIRDAWGRVANMAYNLEDGRIVVQEFEIRKSILEKLLTDANFKNKSTCLAEWKKLGCLDCEEGHMTRKRKIDPFAPDGAKERVYVLRVFAEAEDAEAIRAERRKQAAQGQKKRLPHELPLELIGGDENESA